MTDSAQSLSPLIHLVDDDAAVRDSLSLLISTVGLRVQAWADPQSFMAGPDQQGDWARAGTVAPHGGNAPRQPVWQAGGGIAGAADTAVCGAGGCGILSSFANALRSSTEARA